MKINFEITYGDIVDLTPCYPPDKIGMPVGYSASIPEFIKEYRTKVKSPSDILWVLCRKEYMTDKELKLYAIWCVRQVQHLIKDKRSIDALDVAEQYANGNATEEELFSASTTAAIAAIEAAEAAAEAWAEAEETAWAATMDARTARAAWAAVIGWARVATRAAAGAAVIGWARAATRAVWAAGTEAAEVVDIQIDKLLEMFESKQNAS